MKKCISLHYRYTSFTSDKKINASSGVIWNLMFEGEMLSFNFATDPSLFSPSLGSMQGIAQWWEHSPPINLARVQIPASTPHVGWVCCWFSPFLREDFLRVLQFSPLPKNNISKFQFDQESGRRRTTLWMCYLQIIIYFIFIYTWRPNYTQTQTATFAMMKQAWNQVNLVFHNKLTTDVFMIN